MNLEKNLELYLCLILTLACASYSCQGAVNAEFLDAIKRVESNGNYLAVGDGGKSVGAYQLSVRAWKDVNLNRERHGLKIYGYSYRTHPEISRVYAAQYLVILQAKLRHSLRRAPSKAEIYASYNQGFSKFKQRGFSLSKSPVKTQIAAQKIK